MNDPKFLSKLLRSYSFVAAITIAFYTPIIYFLGITEIAVFSSILVILMLVSYHFSKIGKNNISRIIFFTSIAGVIIVSVANKYYLNGVSLYIFPLLGYNYVLTLNNEKEIRKAISIIIFVTFLIISILLFIKTDIVFTTEYKLFYIFNFVFAFLLLSYLIAIIAIKNYRKERSLEENQANIVTIINTIPQLVLQVNKDYMITTTNNRFINIVKSIFNKTFAVGDSIFDFSLDVDKERVKKAIDLAFMGQQTITERMILIKNNSEMWIKLHYLPVEVNKKINSVLIIVSDETEYKKLLIQTKKLAEIAEESPIPILEIDFNGKIIYANVKFITEFSLTSDQYVPHHWMDFIIECFERKTDGSSFEFEYKGKYYKFFGRIEKTRNNLTGYILDMTNQIESNKELKRQKEFYDTILDNLPSDVVIFDENFKYIYVNNYAIKDEQRRKWIIGKTDNDYFKVRNLSIDLLNVRSLKKSEMLEKNTEVEWIEEFFINGNKKYYLRRLKPIVDNKNNIQFVIGYGIDITNQKNAEIQTENTKYQYEEILNNLPFSVFLKNIDGKYVFGNNIMLSYINKNYSDIIGKLDHDIYPHELADEYRKSDLIAIDKGEYKYEHKYKTPWGEEFILAGKKLINLKDDEKLILGYSLDITDKVKFQEELRKQKELVQKILDISPTLIYIKRKDGTVYLANNSTAELFGYSNPADLYGKNAQQLGADESELVIWSLNDEKVLSSRSIHIFEETFTKDYETKWFLTYKIQFEIDEHEIGILCIGVDITKLKKIQNELIELSTKTNEAAKAKSLFLSNISHELRTPLNAIIGFCELLIDENLDDKSREYTNIILFSARSLLNLVNDILDYTKISESNYTANIRAIHLSDFLDNIYKMFSIWAKKNKIYFKIENDFDHGLVIETDANLLTQILNNVISNAIKFTKVGGVRVFVSIKDNQLYIEVQDTGIGISEEFKPKIFETFEQENSEFNKEFKGTGLGLALTKKFVELLRGEISFDSTKHVGTIFYIRIPVSVKEKGTDAFNYQDKELITSHQTKEVTLLDNILILIVEDNIINQRLLGNILNKYGFTFEVANNGKEAIEMVSAKKFDLILMDLHIPVMDGFACLEYIRSSYGLPTSRDVKVAAVTADVLPETMEKCKSVGFDAIVKKPLDFHQLINILKSLVSASST